MHFVDGITVKASKRDLQINSSALDIQILMQAKCALAVSNNTA